MTTMTSVAAEAVPAGPGEPPRAAALDGQPGRPRWERPGIIGLLGATTVLYLWGLGGVGWGNPFYAAAVQSGTKSWKALLFASMDPQNAITVDKPPASMWVMALSGRVFGFNSWSMMAPQAIMGVLSVGLLFLAVKRWAGPAAGLIAGTALALTPVAAMMFRFNNPDALMVLLIVAAAYCIVRSIDSPGERYWSASTGWLAAAGVLMGFGFLAKMMQAFLVLPGLALVVLVAGAGGWLTRIYRLLTAGLTLVLSAGWFVALVALWPANSRPWIGGSTSNSLWQLAVDYNGLGRIFGNKNGGGHPAPKAVPDPAAVPDPQQHAPKGGWGGFGSEPGITRLFKGELATEFSWLLIAALIALVAGLWLTRRAPRTDRVRASFLLWGGWLLSTAAVLSTMDHGFHSYYVMELSPAVAALAAIGATQLWQRRAQWAARVTLAVMVVGTGAWTVVLLNRTPDWLPWLRWTLLGISIVAAVLLLAVDNFRRFALGIGLFALVSGLLGSAVYTVETISQVHIGGSPIAGPPNPGHEGGFGRGGAPDPELAALISATGNRWAAAASGSQDVTPLELTTGKALLAVGGFSGRDPSLSLDRFKQYVADHEIGYFLVHNRDDNGGWHMGNDDDNDAAKITAWVKANFTSTKIGSIEVYNLNP